MASLITLRVRGARSRITGARSDGRPDSVGMDVRVPDGHRSRGAAIPRKKRGGVSQARHWLRVHLINVRRESVELRLREASFNTVAIDPFFWDHGGL